MGSKKVKVRTDRQVVLQCRLTNVAESESEEGLGSCTGTVDATRQSTWQSASTVLQLSHGVAAINGFYLGPQEWMRQRRKRCGCY
jgi:hypothetical protein